MTASSGVFVDIEIDEDVLTKAGYHHAEDCDYGGWHQDDECRGNEDVEDALKKALTAMHDEHHEGPFRLCRTAPCRDVL